MDIEQKALVIAFYEQYKGGERDYYKYFDIMSRLTFDDQIYHNYFQGVRVAHWKKLTTYLEFKQAVRIEKQNRYKLIDESKGSELSEEQARELAEERFKSGIKESRLSYNAKTTPWGYSIGRQASAEVLRAHNWEWEQTEILNIEFDEEVISKIQAEIPDIVKVIKTAVEELKEV